MKRQFSALAAAALLAVCPGLVARELHKAPAGPPPARQVAPRGETAELPDPAAEISAVQKNTKVRLLLQEVLERNPSVATLAAQARAADQRAPQVRALPDPVASVTAFLLSPETRVGPQQATATVSQKFPWFGKLPLREQAALAAAAAAEARVEARRIQIVTEARRLAYELTYLSAWQREIEADRSTLNHYEELARARYASGVGLEQGVVKIQAEITRDDTRLLDIVTRRAELEARLNALRDRPAGTPFPSFELPAAVSANVDPGDGLKVAIARRPELAEVDARIERAGYLIDLAGKEYKPDVKAGLTYTLVGRRDDRAARANPPENDGKDIVGLFAAVNLPIRREKLAAGVEEAVQLRLAAEESRRGLIARIGGDIGDLAKRLEYTWRQFRLFNDVLIVQAQQSLRSAEAGYAAGTLNALDLLDAERVLLEVRIVTQRSRTDNAVARARLEGVIAAPLAQITELETTK